ncbi:MAG: hypothetical protein Q9163_001100 [Psora crenata]
MSTPSSSFKTSTILLASAAAIATGFLGKLRHFRKALKRESRREARAAREEAEAQGAEQKKAIRDAVEQAKEEGFPTEIEDKEAYFMQEVGRGETLCQDELYRVQAAICFYKALKVYPQPRDLISIYDKTVPKPVIDILAEMIALDPTISVTMSAAGSGSGVGSDRGIDD